MPASHSHTGRGQGFSASPRAGDGTAAPQLAEQDDARAREAPGSRRRIEAVPEVKGMDAILSADGHQASGPAFQALASTRRALCSVMLTSLCAGRIAPGAHAEQEPPFTLFQDSKNGFSLLVPASWEQREKAGATALFEDPDLRSTTIGVVVNPVRIASLKDFGSLEFVADKLLQAEKRKESTKEASILSSVEVQKDPGTVLYYQIDYTLESTRGNKRILTSVAIAEKKLFILNITLPEKAVALSPSLIQHMQVVLESFQVA